MMRVVAIALSLVISACGPVRVVTSPPAREGPTVDIESDTVTVPGGQLYYEVAGSGPAVVLVHGGFGDRRMWDAQLDAFAARYRVVRYDHRGFGRSPAPDSAYSPTGDLIRLLDHLSIDRAHLVGNSMGAAVVLDFALLHPERVMKVVAAASGANGAPTTEEDGRSVIEVFETAATRGTEAAAEMWVKHPMVTVTSSDSSTAPLLRTMVYDNREVFQMRHWPIDSLSPPAFERMGQLRVPVLFVIGDRDIEVVKRIANATAGRVPGARRAIIAGADHLPQMARPMEFNRLVLDFLREQ
ncbi:MAG TPA: alpha/beta fold hydrolase [Gemmatimonadaceae bacterium]|nr:alpha/beta fold hydrolase [Gemmatimonadaceae bacterium]